MTETKSIVKKGQPEIDPTWGQIIDELIEDLENADLPETVIQATEYLLTGHSIHDTAQKLNVPPKTVRGWLSRYPIMAAIVANHRDNLIRWRMAKLEGQFLTAVGRSEELLNVGLSPNQGISPKIYGALAQHVRFIISMFAGQKIDVQVTHKLGDFTLSAGQDALDYIAERLAEQRDNIDTEPIEATYRVIDSKFTTGPLLDEYGNPHYGQLGILDIDSDGILCHICGKRFKALDQHIYRQHNMTADEYEITFMLEAGKVRNARNHDK